MLCLTRQTFYSLKFLAMSFKPSKYQTAVYQHVTDGTGNAVIDAVAGSGKSTTIVEALKLIPKNLKVLFLAFNKAIVEELSIKIGNLPNVDVKTLHALGRSAINNATQGYLDVKGDKYRNYVNKAVEFGGIRPEAKLDWDEMGVYKQNILKLVDLCRVNLCKTPEHLMDIGRKHMIFTADNEVEMALNVVDWGCSEGQRKVIDFTDMIYFPNVFQSMMKREDFQYDFVFIDECQDLNTAQREMFLQTVRAETGRFVAVGDPRQAIYGFAGADVESFETLKNSPNTISLPLSVCYRCDESIIEKAKTIVPQIEAKDNAEKGIVDDNAKVEQILDGDMVLCRITAPLVALCMFYISTGVKAYVKGRDIGMNLINMIKKTKCRYMDDTMSKLEKDLEKLSKKIMKRSDCTLEEVKEDTQYTSMRDKVNAIGVIAKDLKMTDAVMNRIEAIFKDDQKSGICLSTIHKAKGLESDRVFIIRPDKMFLKHCMSVPWMAEQEYNLAYVAYTRAKKYLGFVRDFQMDDEY